MNLDRRQLELFLAVAEHASLTRAASQVALSPSALSRALQALEDRLGVALFARSTRHVALTEAGERFVPAARRLLAEIDAAVSTLRGRETGLSGLVTVALGTAFGCTVMPEVIRRFVAQHPRVQVQLLDGNSRGTTERVLQGKADLGIATAIGGAEALRAELLLHARLGLLMPPEAAGDGVAPPSTDRPLPGRRLVKEAEDTSIMQLLRAHAPAWADAMARGVEVSSLALQLAMVRAGVGPTVVSALGASHPQAEGLRFVPLTPAVERPLALMYRRERPLRPAAAALAQAVRDGVRHQAFATGVRVAA